MPYASEKQRGFFHTATAKAKGITPDMVEEYDQASKGMKLPKKIGFKKSRFKRSKND